MNTNREQMEQAKSLIEQKRYNEARTVLRNVNHAMAIDWLDKLDQLDPPKAKPSTRIPLIFIVITIVVVAAVIFGVVYTQRQKIPFIAAVFASPTPLATLITFPSQTPLLCSYSKVEESTIEEFVDTSTTAAGTPRISISPIILELQRLQRNFSSMDHTPCMGTVTEHVSSGIHFTVNAFQDFDSQKADFIVSSDITLAHNEFKLASDEAHKVGASLLDSRLSDAKLYVWGDKSSDEPDSTTIAEAAGILTKVFQPPNPISSGTSLPSGSTPTPINLNVGKIINPYIDANLQNMSVLQIDILDTASGNYTRAAQLQGTDLNIFTESLNISVQTVAPNTDCPDHIRLSVTRQDQTVIKMAACLKGVVILRGIPDLGGADAPMSPRFTDALAPYLPDDLKRLLNF